jgi:CheY-like chemotaxis protein
MMQGIGANNRPVAITGLTKTQSVMNAKRFCESKRILLLDNDRSVLKSLLPAFSVRGYDVVLARDGAELMAYVRFQRPALILLDLFFSDDSLNNSLTWDSFLAISWLHSLGMAGDIPVIVISSARAKKYANLCLAVGAQAFFHKPIDIKHLFNSICHFVESPLELKAVQQR